jgi:hypothetical protein
MAKATNGSQYPGYAKREDGMTFDEGKEGRVLFRGNKLLAWLLVVVVVAAAWLYTALDMARQSIQLDLHFLGRSIYEAHQENGWWPARIADLDGTEYFNMPYRKTLLDQGNFVVIWQQDLDPKPAANGDRVLAYDNRSVLSRFGNVWVVRGDLRVEHMNRDELNKLLEAAQD